MKEKIRHTFLYYTALYTISLFALLTFNAQASPTLIGSINEAQLNGIKAKNITSLTANHGNLWITDASNKVYQWKQGSKPALFQTGTKEQHFTSALRISDEKFVLTDTRNSKLLISHNGKWQHFSSDGDQEGELKKPSASSWSEHGIIYIADAGNNRVSAFSDEGLFLFTFGNDAGQDAQNQNLSQILSIATDRTGRVYVLDNKAGGRVSVYSMLGKLDTIIGKDELKLLLTKSVQLAAMTVRPDGTLILADKKGGHIIEVDWENMEVISSFGTVGRGRGQFQRVSSLAFDHDGKLYVADQGNAKIDIFQLDREETPWVNLDEDKLSIRPSSVLMSPCDVSYIYQSGQTLCLSNSNDNTVTIRSHGGSIKKTLNARFRKPTRAVYDQDEVLILDKSDIKVFDKQGNFKFNIGNHGRRDGEFIEASGLAITPTSVYVADTGNKRIQIFTRNGLFQRSVGNEKGSDNKLKEPIAVAVDKQSNNIYVADRGLKHVLEYSTKGKLLTRLGFAKEYLHKFQYIYDITIDKDNLLYAMTSTSTNPLSVWVFEKNRILHRFSPFNSKPQAGIDLQWNSAFSPDDQVTIKQLTSSAENALKQVKKLNLDLSSKPIADLFSAADSFFAADNLFGSESWIFNSTPNNPNSLVLVDLNKHARHTFTVSRAPKPVRNIMINGDEKKVSISWLAESSKFTGYYNLYGRKNISSPFKIIQQTRDTRISLQRQKIDSTEYRVSAVSALSKEGKVSSVYQDNFWLGLQAFEAGRFNKAVDLLNEATSLTPHHASAWLCLGKTQMALGLFDKAGRSFTQLSQFKEWRQQSLHLQAQTLIEKKAWLDVKILVDHAESNGEVDATLYSLAANALTHLDDTPSAIFYLNQAVSLEPQSPTWHLELANANYKLGAAKNAKAELLKASKLAGADAQSWIKIAQSYNKHQLYDNAVSSYLSALKHEPANTSALPELAMLYTKNKKLKEARSIATKMASIPELKGSSYHVLGLTALAENNAPQSLAMLAKAGEIEPNNVDIWLSMADAYAALNKPAQEASYLRKAVALDADNFDVHMRLASACALKPDNSCARLHFERATIIDDQNVSAHLGLARALIALGKMASASEHAEISLNLEPGSIDSHLTLAEIQRARGMIPSSIATLKRALRLDRSNMNVHLGLSKAYIENQMYTEATAITEKAILLDIRDPAPLMLSGNIYLARQSFNEAIAAFEKAVELSPNTPSYQQQLNMAYMQKKRSVDSGGNVLGPKLKALQFSAVFAAAYKQYTDVPVGKLLLSNGSAVGYTNIKISLFVKEYMDFPTTAVIEHIPAGGEIEVSLLAAFNNRILSIDEDTGVQTEVRAEYYLAGKPHVETLNESMTIFGKNAIIWDKLDMVGSFTTPKDQALSTFVRQLVNTYNPKNGAVNKNILKAMTVYNGLSAYGIQYIVDPNTPYNKLKSTQLDTIQFPRETLHQRSGDCDDLSILLAASLSNLGIETAILDVPEHLLMMFNTGVPESQKNTISLNDKAFVIINGQVWVPLEATLISSSFTEAWAEGSRKYHLYDKQSQVKVMSLPDAWKNYPPVTLPPASFALTIPSTADVGSKISKEWGILTIKALERQVRPYRIMLALNPDDEQAQMQIAVVFARNGLHEQATTELEAIRAKNPNNVAALNNIGNIHYMRQKYKEALAMYQQAIDIEPTNSDIKVNIAMVNYKMGDALQAKAIFDAATKIDDQVPNRYKQLDFLLHQ